MSFQRIGHFLAAITLMFQTSTVIKTIFLILLVSLQSSSEDCDPHEGIHEGKEGMYRLELSNSVQRLEFWHKDLINTLVTSINVVPVHGRTVAYLGTADGRHIQVRASQLAPEMLIVCCLKQLLSFPFLPLLLTMCQKSKHSDRHSTQAVAGG